jgi:hypothetical protein
MIPTRPLANATRRPRRASRVSQRLSRLVLACALAAAASASSTPAFALRVQAIYQFGPAHVAVAFSDSVDAAQALQSSHYAVTGSPALAIQSVSLQENQRTVILVMEPALPPSASYGLAVTGVTGRHGDALEPGGPTGFTTVAEAVIGIADVHARVNELIDQQVTVVGQVFIRASSTSTPSAYIQDGTGRGLNVFGGSLQPAVDDLGTVAKVTGTVALFFTTVEVTQYSATALATGLPPLGPRVVTAAAASSPDWEGTYIQTTATLTATPSPSGSSHYNYPAADGGTPFIFRVRNSTGINPAGFATGDLVTGAGAGSVFQGTYQAIVGNAVDFYKGRGPGDITPPVLIGASGEGGASSIVVDFSEPLGSGASTASNYHVFPTGSPGAAIAVTTATASGSSVTLTLATALQGAIDYTVEVSAVEDPAGNPVPAGSSIRFVATTPTPFQVTGAFPFGARYVGVGFSRAVNASQAVQVSRYAFTPPLQIADARLQENGRTVILHAATPLPSSTSYSVTVNGITSATGEDLAGTGPFAFQTAAETVVDIADIQADVAAWTGRTVTVIGQTFIPVGSRGGTPSGYVQDGSGRGVNLFGGAVQGAVNQLGSIALVTGTVEAFFTTTEITNYTAISVASGQPHLGARRVGVADANSPQWEGTYIEATATLTDIQPSGTSNTNYIAADGADAITFRVGNGLGIPSSPFAIGDVVTGRGAGGAFQSTYQILVGNREDFFEPSSGPDQTPPTLSAASGAAGQASATVRFSEPVRSNEATLASNYRLHAVSDPGNPLVITAATLAADARSVTLALETALIGGVSYRIEVSNVADLAGNVIAAGASLTFTPQQPAAAAARLVVPPLTLVRNMSRQGEVFRFEIAGAPETRAVCRIFDLQGRLVRVLFDARLSGTPSRTLTWDARDESFEFVPAGLYVCHLQTTDLDGRVTEDRAPVVVAVRLQ